jgi:hypothetical protein
MQHACERGETCTGFEWESPNGKVYLEDKDIEGRFG